MATAPTPMITARAGQNTAGATPPRPRRTPCLRSFAVISPSVSSSAMCISVGTAVIPFATVSGSSMRATTRSVVASSDPSDAPGIGLAFCSCLVTLINSSHSINRSDSSYTLPNRPAQGTPEACIHAVMPAFRTVEPALQRCRQRYVVTPALSGLSGQASRRNTGTFVGRQALRGNAGFTSEGKRNGDGMFATF